MGCDRDGGGVEGVGGVTVEVDNVGELRGCDIGEGAIPLTSNL